MNASHCEPGGGSLALAGDVAHIALVGSPNAGKTTLFNALTGLHARTANYPGVTVSRREGVVELDRGRIVLVDLPGTYSLHPVSPDEEVVVDALRGSMAGVQAPDGIVAVVDATTLERSLLFVGEVLRLGLPTVVVLTMLDEVAARGGSVDLDRLGSALGVPVLGVVGHRGVGVQRLRELLDEHGTWPRPLFPPPDDPAQRAGWVDSVHAASTVPPGPDRRTTRIDAVLLHPLWGTLVFVTVMLAFFQTIFAVATPIADALDSLTGSIANRVADLVPGKLGELLAEGVVGGVGGVVVFVPQITLLFLILALLEKVGYLPRAAFLADRVMGRFGLEGRSFVSMLSSFACAVPGILSTRTIPSERRRIATMLAAPLMTCSARLPVFTLLISAFVPDRAVLGPLRAQGLVLFGLYALGAVSGLLYAAAVNVFAISGAAAPVVMELPPYRRPTAKAVAIATWQGTSSFLRKAGTIILASSIVLWLALHLPTTSTDPSLDDARRTELELEHSAAGRLGKAMVPVFEPLGFEWRTNVAIVGSLAAREVFVSTLAMTTASGSEERLTDRLQELRRPDGTRVYDGPTVAALLVFFVFALQCISTIAVLRRETSSWRYPALAFGSMLAMAWVGGLIARTVVGALT